MGLKAVAAAKAASAAAKQAAAQANYVEISRFAPEWFCLKAIAMAQNTNLAALQAEQAQVGNALYKMATFVFSLQNITKLFLLQRPISKNTFTASLCLRYRLLCLTLSLSVCSFWALHICVDPVLRRFEVQRFKRFDWSRLFWSDNWKFFFWLLRVSKSSCGEFVRSPMPPAAIHPYPMKAFDVWKTQNTCDACVMFFWLVERAAAFESLLQGWNSSRWTCLCSMQRHVQSTRKTTEKLLQTGLEKRPGKSLLVANER